jgi:predicted site-specific integrase-resolvase
VSARITAEQVLTTRQLADRLNVHWQTVLNWRHQGKGPTHFRLGGAVLYAVEDIEAWERSTGRQPI